ERNCPPRVVLPKKAVSQGLVQSYSRSRSSRGTVSRGRLTRSSGDPEIGLVRSSSGGTSITSSSASFNANAKPRFLLKQTPLKHRTCSSPNRRKVYRSKDQLSTLLCIK